MLEPLIALWSLLDGTARDTLAKCAIRTSLITMATHFVSMQHVLTLVLVLHYRMSATWAFWTALTVRCSLTIFQLVLARLSTLMLRDKQQVVAIACVRHMVLLAARCDNLGAHERTSAYEHVARVHDMLPLVCKICCRIPGDVVCTIALVAVTPAVSVAAFLGALVAVARYAPNHVRAWKLASTVAHADVARARERLRVAIGATQPECANRRTVEHCTRAHANALSRAQDNDTQALADAELFANVLQNLVTVITMFTLLATSQHMGIVILWTSTSYTIYSHVASELFAALVSYAKFERATAALEMHFS
jgi:hypothetical protein